MQAPGRVEAVGLFAATIRSAYVGSLCETTLPALLVAFSSATRVACGQANSCRDPKAQTPIDRTPSSNQQSLRATGRIGVSADQRPSLPAINETPWLRTAIDAIHPGPNWSQQILPAAEASRSTLLRRVSFTLLACAADTEELAAFESEQLARRCERQVDRLLASPA